MKAVRVGHEPTLSGSLTVSDLSASGEVTLPIRYPSATYTISFGGIVTILGVPAAGALLTPSTSNQTRTGFTITLQAAPGLGASVSVPWQVSP